MKIFARVITYGGLRTSKAAPLFVAGFLCIGASYAFGQAYFLDNGELKVIESPERDLTSWSISGSAFSRLLDWKVTPAGRRLLLSKIRVAANEPSTERAKGDELWLRDITGRERRLAGSILRARFSPDGDVVAYTTSDCELRVESLEGNILAKSEAAYEPSWKGDGTAVVFAQVAEGRNVHLPENLHIATLSLDSRKVELLTDGAFDDVRPEYNPSGDWILFVSGGRSGLASFWKVSVRGGQPEQVTNIGLTVVTDTFVPTPYLTTTWSLDGRWFLYDFKKGDLEETWGLQFDSGGGLIKAMKLADGLSPRVLADGKSFLVTKRLAGGSIPLTGVLP